MKRIKTILSCVTGALAILAGVAVLVGCWWHVFTCISMTIILILIRYEDNKNVTAE